MEVDHVPNIRCITSIFQDGSFVRRNASSLDNFYTIKAALKATGQISGSVAATLFFFLGGGGDCMRESIDPQCEDGYMPDSHQYPF